MLMQAQYSQKPQLAITVQRESGQSSFKDYDTTNFNAQSKNSSNKQLALPGAQPSNQLALGYNNNNISQLD